MSTNNQKFPEKRDLGNEYTWDIYDADDVDDWFQRCMEDFPFIKKYDTPETMIDALKICRDRSRWFQKWFSQFRNKGDKVE